MRRLLFGWLAAAALVATVLTTVTAVVLDRRAEDGQRRENVRRQAETLAAVAQDGVFVPGGRGRLVRARPRRAERIEAALAGMRAASGEVDVAGRAQVFARAGGVVVVRPARDTGSVRNVLGILLVAGLGAAAVAGLVALLATRGLTRPLGALAAAARGLARGDREARAPAAGPPELVDVARAFNGMADDLAAARDAERRFLLSVGHELKTPLTGVRAHAEALAERAVDPDEAARVIQAETARLERLVADLLDLARVGQGTFTLRRERVALAATVRAVVDRHAEAARARDVELVGEAAGAGTVLADPDRIVQAASNLVDNAIRVTPPGGRVTVAADGATLTVRDTGPGLPNEDLPHAFERFYLHTRHGADGPGGTGVGLAIVGELTAAMGGRAAAHGDPDGGTAFVLTLPCA